MSREGGPISDAELRYIEETFCREESALLGRMLRRARAAGLPEIMIEPTQARLLGVLLAAIAARRALDLGTLFGYSAAVMARAMGPKGRVLSVEGEPRHAEVARANLAALRLAGRVEIRVGAALDVMRALPARSFDLVHIDVDKEGYPRYLEEAVRVLRPGGIVAADNALAFGRVASPPPTGDPDAPAVRAVRRFNTLLASHPRITPMLVPLGDGLAVGVLLPRARRS